MRAGLTKPCLLVSCSLDVARATAITGLCVFYSLTVSVSLRVAMMTDLFARV